VFCTISMIHFQDIHVSLHANELCLSPFIGFLGHKHRGTILLCVDTHTFCFERYANVFCIFADRGSLCTHVSVPFKHIRRSLLNEKTLREKDSLVKFIL